MTAHDTVIAGGLVVTPEDLDKRAEREEGGQVWQASIIATDDEDGNRRTYLGSLMRR